MTAKQLMRGDQPFHPDMGKMSDGAVAKKWGVSAAMVLKHRRRFKIPAFGSVPKARRGPALLKPHLHLLGQVTDAEIARLAGCNVDLVQDARNRAGIPKAARKQPKAEREPKPDRRRRPRITFGSEPWHPLLGTMPDTDIASREDCNLSSSAVHLHRKRFGIAAFEAPKVERVEKAQKVKVPAANVNHGRRGRHAREPAPWHADVATMTDFEVVAKWSVGVDSVARVRRRLGMPQNRGVGPDAKLRARRQKAHELEVFAIPRHAPTPAQAQTPVKGTPLEVHARTCRICTPQVGLCPEGKRLDPNAVYLRPRNWDREPMRGSFHLATTP